MQALLLLPEKPERQDFGNAVSLMLNGDRRRCVVADEAVALLKIGYYNRDCCMRPTLDARIRIATSGPLLSCELLIAS